MSLYERTRALGGSFEIGLAPGKGTTATLTLPLGNSGENKVLSAEFNNSAPKTQVSALPGRSGHVQLLQS